MNPKYRALMIQHGGYIPFTILGSGASGSHKRTNRKKKKSRPKPKKKRTRKKPERKKKGCSCEKDPTSDDPSRYGHCAHCLSNGVIIRGPKDTMWVVDNKKWIRT